MPRAARRSASAASSPLTFFRPSVRSTTPRAGASSGVRKAAERAPDQSVAEASASGVARSFSRSASAASGPSGPASRAKARALTSWSASSFASGRRVALDERSRPLASGSSVRVDGIHALGQVRRDHDPAAERLRPRPRRDRLEQRQHEHAPPRAAAAPEAPARPSARRASARRDRGPAAGRARPPRRRARSRPVPRRPAGPACPPIPRPSPALGAFAATGGESIRGL